MSCDHDARHAHLGELAAELRHRGWRAERGASATGVPLTYIPDPRRTRRAETVCAAHPPGEERLWLYWSFGPAIAPADDIAAAAGTIAHALDQHLAEVTP